MAHGFTYSPSTSNNSRVPARSLKRPRSSCSNDEDSDTIPRKQHRRVSKACERCRLKKTKCDGEIPCQRCINDMVACCERARKKGAPRTVAESCVELLEYQQSKFIAGYLKMFKMMVDAGIWSFGEVRMNSRGMPIVHDILEKLGVMRPGSELPSLFPESFDENRALWNQLEATKCQKMATEEKEEFHKLTLESSPPSLIHTDRESSVETYFSEVKPMVVKDPIKMSVGQAFRTNIGYHQSMDRCTSWNLDQRGHSGTNTEISIIEPEPESTILHATNYDLENYPSINKLRKDLFTSKNWNGFETVPQIVIPSSVQFTSNFTTHDLGTYGILPKPGTSFDNEPNYKSLQLLQSINMDSEVTPMGMKYAYDPYMG